MDISRTKDILNYWFPKNGSADFDKWFMKSSEYDEEIKEKFGDLLKEAENGDGFGWLTSKESFVAYIILTDQFSRHIYRGSGDAFKNDVSTMIFTKLGFDLYRHQLVGYEFMFAFMPYMHTESLKYQKKGEKIFNKHRELYGIDKFGLPDTHKNHDAKTGSRYHLLSPAVVSSEFILTEPVLTQADKDLKMLDQMQTHVMGHKRTIEQFGRFPKRNDALGRKSTDKDLNYMALPSVKSRPY
jgi:uncharacterized protein (DUF924 family)